jgi:hypothetical protein
MTAELQFTVKKIQKHLREQSFKYGNVLQVVPAAELPDVRNVAATMSCVVVGAWRSRHHLVVEYIEPTGFHRLTMQCAQVDAQGKWLQGLTWDTMMELKEQSGHGDKWGVECFPPIANVVNVSNLRHIFLLTEKPPYAW